MLILSEERREGTTFQANSHAFWAETTTDQTLQCLEQELLCDTDPSAGQQCHRVHPLCGEHGAGVLGSCCSEAGIT